MAPQTEQGRTVRIAAACTECQRRKQKCSREWPCNHCQTRRMPHLCKFAPKKVLRAGAPTVNNTNARPVESNGSSNHGVNVPIQKTPSEPAIPDVTGDEDIRILGYLPNEQYSPVENTEGSAAISKVPQALSPEMESALRAVPPKPYTDILVQHFLSDTNYHYYALYPPMFSYDYSVWWTNRTRAQVLTPQFTCLLLRVCACSALYLDMRLQQKLETELGESVQSLSERYHNAAQRLSGTISPGKGGLAQVQQLFLMAFWYKTEGLFIESWHSLSASIHEAQELGLYKRSFSSELSEFDKEMRRRIWCLLYAWDWQMSLMLARPFVINTNYYSFELPNLRLESLDMPEGVPSPMAHIALQCELGKEMSKIPEVPGGIMSPEQTDSIQRTAENWMASFPQAYGITNPDMRWDKDYHYVTFQRYQLQAIGHMMIFFPVKLTLTRSVDSMTDTEKNMRQTAVHCALKLMEISRQLLDCLLPINAKFYLATFLIFDTAACLCSAIAHDSDYSLPQREKIIETIGSALIMLDQVRNTKLGATCYAILKRIVPQLPQELTERILHESMSPGSSSTGGGPRTPSDSHHDNQQFPPGYTNSMFGAPPTTSAFDPGMSSSSGMGFYNAGVTMPQLTSLNDLSDMDLGGLSQIWDWGYLGFTA